MEQKAGPIGCKTEEEGMLSYVMLKRIILAILFNFT
jgi:hypothetical protein